MALVDKKLREFATDKQWSCYEAYCATGSYSEASALIGIADPSQVRLAVKRVIDKALRAGHAPEGFKVARVTTQYGADGEVSGSSVQVKAAADPERVVHLPDPKKITKTSTLYAGDGSVTQQWVLEKPEDTQREALWKAFAEGLSETVARVEPQKAPDFQMDEFLTLYAVGDHHMGQLSWAAETGGDNYDLKISEKLLSDATSFLVSSAPPSRRALVMFLGDFTHTDGYAPMTPHGGHLLDADVRFPKIATAAARAMRNSIDTALTKHENVDVIVTAGNHDPVSTIWLRIALAAAYEQEPRVTIDGSPSKFHYYEFGRNLLGATHGDRLKLENLPAIMATDQPEAWGRSLYRLWLTGHVHHDKVKDLVGARVESVRVLAPNDAYAAKGGYRTPRDMKAIVLHREFGETGRLVAPAAMFRAAA